jgi:hypothetical protein
LLDALGKIPVIAAVAARLATMTAPAAVAMSGCRRRGCDAPVVVSLSFMSAMLNLRFEARYS